MAQQQTQQHYLSQINIDGMIDMSYVDYDEVYLIVDERRPGKWFLRTYDQQKNMCTWTQSKRKAKDFDTESDAIDFAKQIGRSYSVELHDSWLF